MKVKYLFIFFLIKINVYAQNKEIVGMNQNEIKWNEAIADCNINRIDSLIDQNVTMPPIVGDVSRWEIDIKDIEKDTPGKIYYYCLNKNCEYSFRLNSEKYYYNDDLINTYYRQDKDDMIFGNNTGYLSATYNPPEDAVSAEKEKLDTMRIQLKKNLSLLKYIIEKRGGIKQYEAKRLIYPVEDENTELKLVKESLVFFYEQLYHRHDLFESNIEWESLSPEKVLLSYVSSTDIDPSCLEYLLSIIDKSKIKNLFEKMYPFVDIWEWDRDLAETLPSYESEKLLMMKFPEIESYSGYNLLHAAIVNVDISLVKNMINQNKFLLEKKTNPLHPYFIYLYGDEPRTPLELALFIQKKWQDVSKEDDRYKPLSHKFKLQQIHKIVLFLRQNTYSGNLSWILPYDTVL